MTAPFAEVDRQLGGNRFGTMFCLSVPEHCQQPFTMAENMTRLLRHGGKIYVSVPFAWRFHGYPSDYWRFTQEGVKKLFPRLAFDVAAGQATVPSGESRPLDQDIGLIHIGRRSFSCRRDWPLTHARLHRAARRRNRFRTRAIEMITGSGRPETRAEADRPVLRTVHRSRISAPLTGQLLEQDSLRRRYRRPDREHCPQAAQK
jgi:hypothetical protein